MLSKRGMAFRRAFEAHPVAVFILCAYAWSWSWILLAALTRVGVLSLPMKGDLGVLLARYGPSLAALLCLGLGRGAPAVVRLLGRLREIRVGAGWVLLALGPDLVFYPAVLGIGSLLDVRLPQPDAAFFAAFPATWIPAFLASLSTSGIGEELGWRGLLLPLLLRRMSPLKATLMMVPVVSLWHLNTTVVAQGLTEGWPSFLTSYVPGMAGRFALTLPSLCIITLVFCRTRGSLLLMVVAHAAINASYDWADAHAGPDKPALFWVLYGSMLWAIGLWAALRLRRMPTGLVVHPAYEYQGERLRRSTT